MISKDEPERNAIDWSPLTRTEDWWAVWLGLLVILGTAVGLVTRVPRFSRWTTDPLASFTPEMMAPLMVLGIGILAMCGVALTSMRENPGRFAAAFPAVFIMTVLAYLAGAQETLAHYGFGAVLWALVVGLLLSNTVGVPKWIQPAVRTELYIKTGLVLLGAEILFGRLVALGIYGLGVAWFVTPVVLYLMYLFGVRVLKMTSKPLVVTIAAATSVCGVSAAIAASSASKARKEELTLAISITLIFTAIMMVVMPAFVRVVGIDPVVGGAWLGGTIDSTGAVVAAGALLGADAMEVAAVVKMIQNIMIGLLAFMIALIWVTRIERDPEAPRPSLIEVWIRLPKFVIGFIAASLIFSFVIPETQGAHILGLTSGVRAWFFALAFVSIGLESRFADLYRLLKGGSPLVLYLVGQSFNIILTLIAAYVLFSGRFFPGPF